MAEGEDIAVMMYDTALYNKVKSWFPAELDTEILTAESINKRIEVNADKSNDAHFSLPRITLSRDPQITIVDTAKTEMSYNGVKLRQNEETTFQLNSIPVNIDYQIDVYAYEQNQAWALLLKLLFKLKQNPRIVVTITDGVYKYNEIFYMYLNDTITDNSDTSERLYKGQFTRLTIKLRMPNVQLYEIDEAYNVEILAAVKLLDEMDSNLLEAVELLEKEKPREQ